MKVNMLIIKMIVMNDTWGGGLLSCTPILLLHLPPSPPSLIHRSEIVKIQFVFFFSLILHDFLLTHKPP